MSGRGAVIIIRGFRVLSKIEAKSSKFFYSASELTKRSEPGREARIMLFHPTVEPSRKELEHLPSILTAVALFILVLNRPLPAVSLSRIPALQNSLPPSMPSFSSGGSQTLTRLRAGREVRRMLSAMFHRKEVGISHQRK